MGCKVMMDNFWLEKQDMEYQTIGAISSYSKNIGRDFLSSTILGLHFLAKTEGKLHSKIFIIKH